MHQFILQNTFQRKVIKVVSWIFQLPDEEPIYISVSGDDEEEAVKIPPIYHVLEDLRPKDEGGQDSSPGEDQS